MKTSKIVIKKMMWSRLNELIAKAFLDSCGAKHAGVAKERVGAFYDCVAIEIDEESLFQITLKHGSLMDGLDSYKEKSSSSVWKEYVNNILQHNVGAEWKIANQFSEPTESDDV